MYLHTTPKILNSDKPNLGFGRMDFMGPFIPYVYAHDIYNGKELKDILTANPFPPSGGNLLYEDQYLLTYSLDKELESPYEHLEAEMKGYCYALHEDYELKLSCSLSVLETADFVCFEISPTPNHQNRVTYTGYVVKIDYYKSILSEGFKKSIYDEIGYREQLHLILRHTTLSPQLYFEPFRDILVDVINEETIKAIFTYFVETLKESNSMAVTPLKRAFKSSYSSNDSWE